jgi:hypothetical protein
VAADRSEGGTANPSARAVGRLEEPAAPTFGLLGE